MIIEISKYILILISLAILLLRHKIITDNEVIVILLVIITNIGISVGGYSLIFYVVIIPLLTKMRFTWINLSVVAMIFFPLDFLSVISETLDPQAAYLSDSLVLIDWKLGIGSLIKPALNMVLLFSLSLGTLMTCNKKLEEINVYELR